MHSSSIATKATIAIGALATTLTVSCANIDSIWRNRSFGDGSRVISVDAKQRLIISKHRPFIPGEPPIEVVCAESSPDALSVLSNQTSLRGSYSNAALEAMFANNEAASTIGVRTTTIQTFRDFNFWLCEDYANGALGPEMSALLMERSQSKLIGTIAIEDLTTAAATQSGLVTVQQASSSQAGAASSPNAASKSSPKAKSTSAAKASPAASASPAEESSAATPLTTSQAQTHDPISGGLTKGGVSHKSEDWRDHFMFIKATAPPGAQASGAASPASAGSPAAASSATASTGKTTATKTKNANSSTTDKQSTSTGDGIQSSRTGATLSPELINAVKSIVHDVAAIDETRDFCLMMLTAPARTPPPYPWASGATPSSQQIKLQEQATNEALPPPTTVPISTDFSQYEARYYQQRLDTRDFCLKYLAYRMDHPLIDDTVASLVTSGAAPQAAPAPNKKSITTGPVSAEPAPSKRAE